jgi:hypothetical protein
LKKKVDLVPTIHHTEYILQKKGNPPSREITENTENFPEMERAGTGERDNLPQKK